MLARRRKRVDGDLEAERIPYAPGRQMSKRCEQDCVCGEHPFSDEMPVWRARDAYLAENGFSVAEYDDKWTKASFFGIPLRVPNTARHRWAIMLHDLHHVATGYGTSFDGEGEIS